MNDIINTITNNATKGVKIKEIAKELNWSDNIIDILDKYAFIKDISGDKDELFLYVRNKKKPFTVLIEKEYMSDGINTLVHAPNIPCVFVLKSYQLISNLTKRDRDVIGN